MKQGLKILTIKTRGSYNTFGGSVRLDRLRMIHPVHDPVFSEPHRTAFTQSGIATLEIVAGKTAWIVRFKLIGLLLR
jgi:hypothetical protein